MKHIAIASLLVVIVTALVIVGLDAMELVPPLASEEGALVDQMFALQLYVIAFFFSLILVFILYSVVVFRRKPGETDEGAQVTGNTPLEIAWTVIPLIIVMGIGVLGAKHLGEITAPDPEELVIEVTGFQFGWRFDYPEQGASSSELYLPLGRQVLFRLTSTDVIHSFWVPEFRVKQDAVPGRWTELRVTPTETGDYRVRCAELCGYSHTTMLAPVIVVEEAEFESWLAGQEVDPRPPEEKTPVELGAYVAEFQGCLSCHSTDGSDLVGPTWRGLFGSERPLADGTTVVADEDYVIASIMHPEEQAVAGFPMIMPIYETVLSEDELQGLVEYIKSLSE
ncbi:cytochrome c oxidase subunit II [Chloroflexota bacterium]